MMLRIEGLSYGYAGRRVLDAVSLSAGAGEVVSLLGVNGAGKSTLLKCVSRFLSPQAGEVHVADRPIGAYGRSELARAVAYVPQQSGPAMSMRVVDMVALGRTPHRGRSNAARDREVTLDCIERLDLGPLALRSISELSGGERRRVLIARALAQETPVLLLDEPTSDLDLRHQLETMALVRRLADEQGVTALVAIHDLSLAGRFSDRLVLLAGGKVQADGPWRQVLTRPHLEPAFDVGVLAGELSGLPYVFPTSDPAAEPRSAS